MSRLFLKQVLLPFLVAGSFVLLDLFADLAADTEFHFALSHIFMDLALVLVTGFLALRGYRHAKALERANRSLQHAIEERQRAEARVQHLASFPQLNPDPVFEVDGSGNITYCNAAGDEMLAQLGAGFAPRTTLPDDLAKVLQEFDPAKKLKTRHELEVGSATFEALVHAIPAFNVTRIYAHDITARKRAEAALREANERLQEQAVEVEEHAEELRTQAHELANANEQLRRSEQRFRLALKNAPVTVAAQDRDLRFLWAYNQRTVDPASVIGKTDADLFAPEDAARLVALKRRVLQTGEEISDQFWLTSGGQRVFLEVYLEPIRDAAGQITSIGIATVNLTERRRIEEALRDSEDRLRRIARAGRIGFYEWKAEQDNAYWSPEAYELFGRGPGAPTGFAGWLACVHADDRERVARNATALLEQARTGLHGSSQRDEYRVVHDDGAVLWLEATTTFDLDGDHLVMRGAVRDITERKQVEAELEKIAQQRQLALNAARMGWWHYDPNTRVASWDERYREIFGVAGYTRPNDEILAQIIHPDDRSRLGATVEAALDPIDPQPFAAEYRINRPDGALRWIEAHGIASFEGSGENRRATSFVGTVADISERKRAEQQLRASEQWFRALAEALPQIVWTANAEGAVEWYNQYWYEYTGEPQGVGADLSWDKVAHPDDLAHTLQRWRDAVEHKTLYQNELRVRRHDGQYRWFLGRAWPLLDANGDVVRWFGTDTDIQDMKSAEVALATAHERTRRVLHSIAEGYYALDAHWRFVEMNPMTERHFKRSAAELLGKEIWGETGIPPGNLIYEQFHEAAASGRPVQFEAESHVNPGKWSALYLYPRPDSLEVYFHDITERKRAEAEIQQVAEALRAANEELTRFNHAMTGRELRMIELKGEVNALCEHAGQPRRYPLDFEKEGM